MLEQLFSLIQQEGQQDIINNNNIPNARNNETVGLATESVFSGLQGALANGGLEQVMGLFSGNGAVNQNNPLVGNITNHFVGNIMDKLGIESGMAKTIAMSLIPMVLGKLVNKTNDSNDGQFDINNILGSLIGGNASQSGGVQLPNRNNQSIDFGSILSKVSQGGGMDIDGDGDVDMQDIMAAVSGAAGNAQQNQQQQSGGGIMDLLGGFMK